MHFKLISINKISLAYGKLILDNVPGARACRKTDTSTGRCTGTMSNILLNTQNCTYMTINAV